MRLEQCNALRRAVADYEQRLPAESGECIGDELDEVRTAQCRPPDYDFDVRPMIKQSWQLPWQSRLVTTHALAYNVFLLVS